MIGFGFGLIVWSCVTYRIPLCIMLCGILLQLNLGSLSL
jgi:hypothetical protein